MKLKIVLPLIMLLAVSFSGCEALDEPETPPPPTVPENPFAGEWKMERVGIEPAVDVPDIVINMFLDDKPVWKIAPSLTGNMIRYNGIEVWFTLPRIGLSGVVLQTNPPVGTYGKSTDSKITSLTVNGGGGMTVEKVNSFFGLTPEFQKISATYKDKVTVTFAGADRINAVIEVDVRDGEYLGEDESNPGVMVRKTLPPVHATVTYSGTRK